MPQLVWVTRRDGAITWWNKQSRSYCGKALDEIRNAMGGLLSCIPDDLSLVQEKWRASLDSGEPLDAESRIIRHDGLFNWFLIRGVPVRGPDGVIVRWFGTATIIEDYKQAEAETLRLTEGLENRVRERTGELASVNQELAHVQAQFQAILHSVTRVSIIITDPQGHHYDVQQRRGNDDAVQCS